MGGVSGEVRNNMRHGAKISRHYTRSKDLLVEFNSIKKKNKKKKRFLSVLFVLERFYAQSLRALCLA